VLAVPLVLRTWRQLRRTSTHGVAPAEIATHAAIVLGLALLHAAVLPLLTRALFIPLGPGGIPRAATWALAAYLPLDALTYCITVLLGHASDTSALARSAAERESAVRGELATTRLATLRAQLRPHFLFNALNAATVLARRGDSESAARVLNHLAELLRYVLRGAEDESVSDAGQMVRLGDELDFADSYLTIERERFPDRLQVKTEVTPDAREALVPHLLLQPLVENAVHHGVGARVGAGVVTIRAWRIEQILHVAVENDGHTSTEPAEDDSGRESRGIGLANTRARLTTIYGDRAQLTLLAREGGGATAHVAIPYRA
jgi:LytS/YehU family sensor histidine kinase